MYTNHINNDIVPTHAISIGALTSVKECVLMISICSYILKVSRLRLSTR